MAEGKWISDLTWDTPLVDAARRVLSIRLEVVRDNLGLALREADKDPEHVHQLRVSTRRAGAALDIFALCLPENQYEESRKHLRRLRRASGAVRDWDVLLVTLTAEEHRRKRRHRPGLDFLLGHALGQRIASQVRLEEVSAAYPFAFERLMAETVAAIQKPRNDHGVRMLLDLAGPQILSLARDLDQAAACDLSDYERLHRVRIVGKRLRYAMEIFADCFTARFREELYPAVEEMQEILGRANDSHVAAQRLSALGERAGTLLAKEWKRLKPGIEGQLWFHQQRLPQERQQFEEWWQRWQRLGGAAAFTALLKRWEPAASSPSTR